MRSLANGDSDRTSKDLVYLITDGSDFKIGKSNSKAFKGRLSSIQTGNSKKISVVCLATVAEGYRAEAYLHKKYDDRLSRGEWFSFSESEAEEVKSTFAEIGRIIPCNEPEEEKHFSHEEVSILWESAAKYLVSTCEENSYNPKWVFHRLETLSASLSAWKVYAEWRGYKPGWADIKFAEQDKTLPPPAMKARLRGISQTRVQMERQKQRREERQAKRNEAKANATERLKRILDRKSLVIVEQPQEWNPESDPLPYDRHGWIELPTAMRVAPEHQASVSRAAVVAVWQTRSWLVNQGSGHVNPAEGSDSSRWIKSIDGEGDDEVSSEGCGEMSLKELRDLACKQGSIDKEEFNDALLSAFWRAWGEET